MENFEPIRRPTSEIDGAVDELCIKEKCHIKYLPGHLDDGTTWIFRPVTSEGTVDIRVFAKELDERLNFETATDFLITIEQTADRTYSPFIKIEPIND
jgi:hypothetical protein